MQLASNSTINSLLAGTTPRQHSAAAARLSTVDAEIRGQALRSSASAGADATVTTNLEYSVGPDGKLYATGGTVNTSRRVVGPKPSEQELRAGNIRSADEATQANANDNTLSAHKRPPTLSEITNPQIVLTPIEFAKLQEEQTSDNSAQVIAELQMRDVAVRAHEAQHFAVAGGLAQGTPEYEFTQGPDGKLYAAGGHVNIRTSGSQDPAIAAREAGTMNRAANAPADTSAQDISVANSSSRSAASLYTQAVSANNPPLFDLVG